MIHQMLQSPCQSYMLNHDYNDKSKCKVDTTKNQLSNHASTKSKSSLSTQIPDIPYNNSVIRSDKMEFDLKPDETIEVETLTNSKILCNIGYGGFSTVKLIYNQNQKVYYAMKVINLKNKKFKKKPLDKNKELIEQEILVNYCCKHSNIMKLFGYFTHKNYFLIILEYINNRDLKHFMKKYKNFQNQETFSEPLTAHFILQVLKSLGYLKKKNIIHRDIKPENILLTTNYIAKLGDFTLARKIDTTETINTSRSGTIPYLSPECIIKKTEIKSSQCEKIDLFSLGVVMYLLLFNRHPFQYKNTLSCTEYTAILEKTEIDFTTDASHISPSCIGFLKGLLDKDIETRFNNEQALQHKWALGMKAYLEDFYDKFEDGEKLVCELNKETIDKEYFDKFESFEVNYSGLLPQEVTSINVKEKVLKTKRKRQAKNLTETLTNNTTPQKSKSKTNGSKK